MKNLEKIKASQYAITSDGKLFSIRLGRFMTGWIGTGGYRLYSISNDQGKRLQLFAHKLVAEAFHENPDRSKFTQVNHIDGNKTNNHVNNLEWCTPGQNTHHAHSTGLNKGKNYNSDAKVDHESVNHCPYKKAPVDAYGLCEEDIRVVCSLIQEGYRDVDISRITSMNRRYVNKIRYNECPYWIHVTEEYTFNFKKEQRLSPEKVLQVCEGLEKGVGVLKLARDLDICRKQVGNIKNRKTFTNISSKYKF